jgi:hypothetical protein
MLIKPALDKWTAWCVGVIDSVLARLSGTFEVVTGCRSASLAGGSSWFIMKKREGRWIRTQTKRMITI